MEKSRFQKELADSEIKRYLLYLKATEMERQLDLPLDIIKQIREKVVAQAPITEFPIIMGPSQNAANATTYGFAELESDEEK